MQSVSLLGDSQPGQEGKGFQGGRDQGKETAEKRHSGLNVSDRSELTRVPKHLGQLVNSTAHTHTEVSLTGQKPQ